MGNDIATADEIMCMYTSILRGELPDAAPKAADLIRAGEAILKRIDTEGEQNTQTEYGVILMPEVKEE